MLLMWSLYLQDASTLQILKRTYRRIRPFALPESICFIAFKNLQENFSPQHFSWLILGDSGDYVEFAGVRARPGTALFRHSGGFSGPFFVRSAGLFGVGGRATRRMAWSRVATLTGLTRCSRKPASRPRSDVALHAEAAQGDAGEAVAVVELLHHLVAAAVGEAQVADDDVERLRLGQPQRRGHAVGPGDLVADALEQPDGRPGGVDVVLDQEDADPAGRAVGRRGGGLLGPFGGGAIRGSATTNDEPRPGPSLAARIVPPWRSTTALAIERPSPSPPNCRVIAGSPCSNGSKMCGSASGSIPLPVSRTSTSTRPVAGGPGRHPDRPAGRGELRRVLHQVPDHLLQPRRVGVHQVGPGRQRRLQRQAPCPAPRRRRCP